MPLKMNKNLDLLWVGHRGCIESPWIENTSSAIEWSILKGAPAVEIDVWWVNDDYRVFHDSDARRLVCTDLSKHESLVDPQDPSGGLDVSFWTDEQWDLWQWPEGLRIEKLSEMWDRWAWRFPCVLWNVEFKGPHCGSHFLQWLDQRYRRQQFIPRGWVSSFNIQEIHPFWNQKKHATQWMTLDEYEMIHQWDIGLLIDENQSLDLFSCPDFVSMQSDFLYLSPSTKDLRPELWSLLTSWKKEHRKRKLIAWSVDHESDSQITTLHQLGADGFFKNQWNHL